MDNNLDKKEKMLEREPLEEAIDGSSIESESESVDSVAPTSKGEVEAGETETEQKGEPAAEDADDSPDAGSTESAKEKSIQPAPLMPDEKSDIGSSKTELIEEEVPAAGALESSEDTKPETKSEESLKEVEAKEDSNVDDESDGEHKVDVGRAKWYTIRTFSGQEKKIRDSLIANIHREGMDDRIFEVLVPTENVVEMRDGKKRSRVKVYFPGYVLIQMNLDKETRFLIEDTYGVLNFIGPGNNPQELKEKELRRILGDTEKSKTRDVMAVPYAVGDSIKVVDGPFNDFSGYVQEINEEKQKVKVMVSIFGRATPVELDFLQVAIEK